MAFYWSERLVARDSTYEWYIRPNGVYYYFWDVGDGNYGVQFQVGVSGKVAYYVRKEISTGTETITNYRVSHTIASPPPPNGTWYNENLRISQESFVAIVSIYPDLVSGQRELYAHVLQNPTPPDTPDVPVSVSIPITYYPTGCVLQGPSEAEQGDTVNVLVTPGPGKVIKPESIQVYDRSGLITHTYSSGILSFDVPDGQ